MSHYLKYFRLSQRPILCEKRTPTTHPGREKQAGLGFHDYSHDLRIYLFVYSDLAASTDGGNL